MPNVTVAQICDAIETTLAAASTLRRTQSYNELTESAMGTDMPLLQVWPNSGEPVSVGGTSDRRTFSGQGGANATPVRQKGITIYADYYAAVRAYLREDMQAVVDGIDAMIDILEQQNNTPYFGLAGIKMFQWSWVHATFPRPEQERPAIGARFTITITLF